MANYGYSVKIILNLLNLNVFKTSVSKMATTNREKRYSTDIGKDSDDLIGKLKLLTGNKKITKQQIIYKSLEFCYSMKLNLNENPEKPIRQKDLDRIKNEIVKHIQNYNDEISSYVKITDKLIKSL